MSNTFDRDALQAGLAYARWLHMRAFRDWMNSKNAEMGLPPEPHTVCMNTVGKEVFERVRADVLARRDKRAGVLLLDGERQAVVAEIISRMHQVRR